MADQINFKIDNIKQVERALKNAGKDVGIIVKRELFREGTKAQTAFRRSHLFGSPGINLPRRLASTTKRGKTVFKKRKVGDAKKIQLAHVIIKTFRGKNTIILAGYLSRFLGFHKDKLSAAWLRTFRGVLPNIRPRLEKEVARVTQVALDKGLRDAARK